MNLEARLSEHFGVRAEQVVVCANGTVALEGAVATAPAGHGAWEVPSWTFTATALAALRSGDGVRFVDVDLEQRAKFTPGASRGIDVLPFGAAHSWRDRILPVDVLIVDAAAAFDASEAFDFPSGQPTAVCVSLHATKSMPAGEGGIFISNDPGWAADFRRWTNFGMSGSRISQVLGTNGKMSEIVAAVAHASLDEWPERKTQWRALEQQTREVAVRLGIEVPGGTPGRARPYWNIQVRDESVRDGLAAHLAANQIDTRRWWESGCHNMPAFANVPRGPLPNTETFARTTLGLPCHLGLTAADISRIELLLADYLDSDSA